MSLDGMIQPVDDTHDDYLTDESGMKGHAESISFPGGEEDLREILGEMKKRGIPVTVQGGLTGIVGAGVPEGGHILNLSRMRGIKEFSLSSAGQPLLTVDPGLPQSDLEAYIRRLGQSEPLFWPPDPTEPSATIGGIVASGAQGISTGLYGPTELHIDALRVMDSEGGLRTIEGGPGFYFGSEGMFGALTELRLKLSRKPKIQWGIGFFFPTLEGSYPFAEKLKERETRTRETGAQKPLKADLPQGTDTPRGIAVAEYFDRTTLDIIQEHKAFMSAIKGLPDIPEETAAMVYVEIHGPGEGYVEDLAGQLMDDALEYGSDPDQAWAVSGEGEVDKMRAFRHAAPEAVNLILASQRRNCPEILKSASDMTLPGEDFGVFYQRRRGELVAAGLRAAFFGHIMDNHLHINILPKDLEEYRRAGSLLHAWAIDSSEHHGRVVTEHGVGKLKKSIYAACVGSEERQDMGRRKLELDPAGMWNPRNGSGSGISSDEVDRK